MEDRESFKISAKLLQQLRVIAGRDGLILARFIESLIRSGLKVQKKK